MSAKKNDGLRADTRYEVSRRGLRKRALWRHRNKARLKANLIRHFGDIEDGLRPCGICDFCAPDSCVAQRFRQATTDELKLAAAIMADTSDQALMRHQNQRSRSTVPVPAPVTMSSFQAPPMDPM